MPKKFWPNLIDIWEHVGEAGGEDDAPAKHGEAGEQGHHGGRLEKRGEGQYGDKKAFFFRPAGFLSDAANPFGHLAVEERPPIVKRVKVLYKMRNGTVEKNVVSSGST